MRAAPTLLQRLLILKGSLDRRRLRIALDLLRQSGPRMLLLQLMAHTAFRWRLRRFGVGGMEAGLIAPIEEAEGPFELYREGAFPATAPLVSVVIPCFNYGRFVAEAVDSVLAQTFQDFEIIIVEGGSTDATTRKAVATLRRPKTRVLFRDEPCRAGDNRNHGIGQAQGKYICCLDADDMLRPTYLEKAVFLLEVCGCDVVSTSVRRFGAEDGGYGVIPNPTLSDMLQGNHVTTCAVFRRALWEQAGGFRDTAPDAPFVHEDWSFWTRLAALGARIVNISGEQLFLYRAHPTPSLSTQPGLLANAQQAPLVRKMNQDVITPEALARSRIRAVARLRALDGLANLVQRSEHENALPTVLLAVPHLVLGGAERLLSQVVAGLCESGFRIVIVTTIPTWPQLGDTTSWFEPSTREIYHLPRFLPQSRWLEFIEYLVSSRHVQALLLAGSPWFYEIIPGLKGSHPDLRIVDLLFNTVAHTDSNRSIAAALDVTLVESESVRSWLLAKGEGPDRICLIRSGIDLERYRPSGKPVHIMDKLDFSADTFVVGFSGRLAEEKAPLAFVTIAGLVQTGPAVRFIMTGTGPLEDKVRAALKNAALGERFCFAGMVDDIRDYLACYDVLVLPSILDGHPTVVMEALAMGIPVIASRVGSLPDLIVHGETGFLCDPTDFQAFANCVRFLYDHPLDHARMRDAARQFALEHFSLAPMVAGYVRVFDRLVRNATSPAFHDTPACSGALRKVPAKRRKQAVPEAPLVDSRAVATRFAPPYRE